ncbi:MAG: precorrin-2 C(20)-methyltransferase [Desulfonatronovibrio sp. MSAO_Bac4]|nr:MAG: precorrin-2 C(20)-methyltransferase [Desulfonatronovibrio sp. MSAO_Bac4]
MNNKKFDIQKGHFYAVGVGPGGADLLTLRAVRVIEESEVIICPKSASARSSLALDIIKDFVRDQEIIEHVYPMQRSQEQVENSWIKAADIIKTHCLAGKTVCQVTLGDPNIYSTCAYVMPLIEEVLGRDRIHVVPGITAFQSSAANFPHPLTTQEDRLILMPGSDLNAVENALKSCETLVLYKAGKNLPAIVRLLEKYDLASKAGVVFNSEMPDREEVFSSLDEALEGSRSYLACVIVYVGRKGWKTVD